MDPAEVEVTLTAQPDPETAAAIERADALAAEAAALQNQAAELRAAAVLFRRTIDTYVSTLEE